MTMVYLIVAIAILISLGGGAYQALRGPTPGDRMLVMQLLGTGAVAVLILVGKATNDPALIDVALVLALLAAIAIIAFVQHTWKADDHD
jgi:multicomponent Na+:H+ antiporter subunit F